MADSVRKKSPRAPSFGLEEALTRALLIYEKEHRHEVPVDVVAQDMGYNGARNGAALSALASLRYFGLVDRPRDGMLCITKDVETYKFAPEDNVRRQILKKWVATPPIFAELLEKYSGALPSDATIKFDLIQRGFTPTGADDCLAVFRRSVDFARCYEHDEPQDATEPVTAETPAQPVPLQSAQSGLMPRQEVPLDPMSGDRIPVRLPGNRRAWLEIPAPFYESDKERIKAQIDLLLTDNEKGAE